MGHLRLQTELLILMSMTSSNKSTHTIYSLSKVLEAMETPFGYTTVFEEMINLYDRLKNDMMKTIVSYVFMDVKARSKPYRDDR